MIERETPGLPLNPSSHFQPIYELCACARSWRQEKETMEIRVTWTDNESVHRLPHHAGLPDRLNHSQAPSWSPFATLDMIITYFAISG